MSSKSRGEIFKAVELDGIIQGRCVPKRRSFIGIAWDTPTLRRKGRTKEDPAKETEK